MGLPASRACRHYDCKVGETGLRELTDLQFGPNVYKTGLLYQATLAIIDLGDKFVRAQLAS
jgi:hypothetical protein